MSLLRYPGGKSKLAERIGAKLHETTMLPASEYRGPFLGGGSVAIALLEDERLRPQRLWLNDRDPGLAALWTAVVRYPEQLMERVVEFQPTVGAFYALKAELLGLDRAVHGADRIVEVGFKALALNRISWGGLGVMASGPMGGTGQRSKHKVGCRWSPRRICAEIDRRHRLLASVDLVGDGCTCLDFEEVLADDDEPALVYVDPPYVGKGQRLYRHAFQVEDHERLARALRHTKHRWVLSYDDCPEIRELYAWAEIEKVPVDYSVKEARRASELLISPRVACLVPSTPARGQAVGLPPVVTLGS